jgi:uncharacterized protein (UPF0332 family)
LGQGFMTTAEVGNAPSEYEIRNAFSRAYYALFHACYAFLLGQGTDPVLVEQIAKDKGRLHSALRHPMGRMIERYVWELYDRRRQSDYEAEWQVPSAAVAQWELKRARTHFYWLYNTARRRLL